MSTASLQKHRVLIASLFLPTTINFDPDAALRTPLIRAREAMLATAAAPSSDEDAQKTAPKISLSLPATPTAPAQPTKAPLRPKLEARLKSIVDDLTVSRTREHRASHPLTV
jgi:hypothetical protein